MYITIFYRSMKNQVSLIHFSLFVLSFGKAFNEAFKNSLLHTYNSNFTVNTSIPQQSTSRCRQFSIVNQNLSKEECFFFNMFTQVRTAHKSLGVYGIQVSEVNCR